MRGGNLRSATPSGMSKSSCKYLGRSEFEEEVLNWGGLEGVAHF